MKAKSTLLYLCIFLLGMVYAHSEPLPPPEKEIVSGLQAWANYYISKKQLWNSKLKLCLSLLERLTPNDPNTKKLLARKPIAGTVKDLRTLRQQVCDRIKKRVMTLWKNRRHFTRSLYTLTSAYLNFLENDSPYDADVVELIAAHIRAGVWHPDWECLFGQKWTVEKCLIPAGTGASMTPGPPSTPSPAAVSPAKSQPPQLSIDAVDPGRLKFSVSRTYVKAPMTPEGIRLLQHLKSVIPGDIPTKTRIYRCTIQNFNKGVTPELTLYFLIVVQREGVRNAPPKYSLFAPVKVPPIRPGKSVEVVVAEMSIPSKKVTDLSLGVGNVRLDEDGWFCACAGGSKVITTFASSLKIKRLVEEAMQARGFRIPASWRSTTSTFYHFLNDD
ncbi:MAG: hypothetical protein D6820_16125 [Lentisphaerae bacterium]|nr:MAG: hypothetical protein D6820_16125 [Lentisphaerota bacterium]